MPRAERIVEVIPATWNPTDESAGEIRKLRVAAYCRVSTELEQQQSSYDIQMCIRDRYEEGVKDGIRLMKMIRDM